MLPLCLKHGVPLMVQLLILTLSLFLCVFNNGYVLYESCFINNKSCIINCKHFTIDYISCIIDRKTLQLDSIYDHIFLFPGVLMALCCSSNHSSHFVDVLTQVNIHDLSIHNSLAVFTSILIGKFWIIKMLYTLKSNQWIIIQNKFIC